MQVNCYIVLSPNYVVFSVWLHQAVHKPTGDDYVHFIYSHALVDGVACVTSVVLLQCL